MNQYKLKIIEKLLNLLISMGWKPWGKNRNYIHIEEWIIRLIYKNNIWDRWSAYVYSLNDLCSIDSWLWQFVVEKWLYEGYNINDKQPEYIKLVFKAPQNNQELVIKEWNTNKSEYWVFASSIQEDKTKFILDNINI